MRHGHAIYRKLRRVSGQISYKATESVSRAVTGAGVETDTFKPARDLPLWEPQIILAYSGDGNIWLTYCMRISREDYSYIAATKTPLLLNLLVTPPVPKSCKHEQARERAHGLPEHGRVLHGTRRYVYMYVCASCLCARQLLTRCHA